MTPFEQYTKMKPDVSNLKVVGCRAYVHIPQQKRAQSHKLTERAWIGYLIGFEAHNIWIIYHPKSREVVRVRDVIFQEDCLFKDESSTQGTPVQINQFQSMTGPSEEFFCEPRLNRWNTIFDSDKVHPENYVKARSMQKNSMSREVS